MIKQFQNFAVAGILISSLIPSYVQSPQDLANWLEKDFTYQEEAEGQDYWKTPKETIRDKGGDCDDLAFLSQHVLNKLGYKTHVLAIISMKDKKKSGHAICIFKNKNGNYEHFSNTNYIHIEFQSIRELLNFTYNDWIYYYECDNDKNCFEPVRRIK